MNLRNMYKPLIVPVLFVIVIFTSTVIFYRHKISSLRQALYDKEIERIIEVDRVLTDMLERQSREIDSMISVEQRRYNAILIDYNNTKMSYEKIASDYSDIVIDRPEF